MKIPLFQKRHDPFVNQTSNTMTCCFYIVCAVTSGVMRLCADEYGFTLCAAKYKKYQKYILILIIIIIIIT